MEKSASRVGAFVATAAVGLWAAAAMFFLQHLRRRLSNDKALKLYWDLWSKGDTYWLINVRVPVSVLDQNGDTTSMKMPFDHEGLVECHVKVKSGRIVDVSLKEPSVSSFITKNFRMIDCRHAILVPCFSDAHTHLVKTQTVPRNRNHTGTMSEALECEFADQPRWKSPSDDITRRMHFAVQCALHHGTRSIRTHLDGCSSEDPEVVEAVFRSFDEIRETYQDQLSVQGVANMYLQHWMEDYAKDFADRASQHRNVVLGAYVGRNHTGIDPDPEFVESFDALFRHAARLKMDVDMHIDESSNPDCCALASLCVSLARARQEGYQGRVICGHCCALALQDTKTQKNICKQLSALDVYVVANPFTNLGLQDRKGGKAPHCVEHPSTVPRTPQWRGITLLQELRAAGVPVASASDNVRDHWYAFGDYDLLNVWKLTTEMSHTELIAGHWADLVSSMAGEAMGLPHHVGYGQVADLILFPSARRISELFARPQIDRLVIRKGRVQTTSLPDFAELDDLVAVKTERSLDEEQTFILSS